MSSVSGNMKNVQFYVCPLCGNIITALAEGDFSCCETRMEKKDAKAMDENHLLLVKTIDEEYSVTMQHPMSKEHYVSFIAYVTSNASEIIKLYPEQEISVRFRKKGHGILYAYCSSHGLYKKII